jgi:ubiquinone/menaquinone biosynthesis C-methylase UbiE
MMMPKWFYNELLPTGVDYTSIEEVKRYDTRMSKLRDIPGEIDIIVDALKPTPDSKILEIGSGTGESALALAKLCHKLYAIDVSPIMIDYSREKARSNNINNIEFQNAGFLTYEHTGEKFDHIYSQLALHHLPDFWKLKGLKKVYGLLKPGGKFFLMDVIYPSVIDDYDSFFEEIIKELEESVGVEFTQEYYDHISKEFSTLDWIMEKLLSSAGFTILHSSLKNKFIATYVCRK